jgi:hypothetical protein
MGSVKNMAKHRFGLWLTACTALLLPAGLYAAACGQVKPDAQDAMIAAPANHKVVFENERVRVLEATVPAHGKEPAHSHIWPGVLIGYSDGKVSWSEAGMRKANDNAGEMIHNIRVELKQFDCPMSTDLRLPPTDGITIKDPTLDLALDNKYVRVLKITIKPGGREPLHTHTWPSVVVYPTLPQSRRFTNDGKSPSERPEIKGLQVTFDSTAQPLHGVDNLGTRNYVAYRVELKPIKQ